VLGCKLLGEPEAIDSLPDGEPVGGVDGYVARRDVGGDQSAVGRVGFGRIVDAEVVVSAADVDRRLAGRVPAVLGNAHGVASVLGFGDVLPPSLALRPAHGRTTEPRPVYRTVEWAGFSRVSPTGFEPVTFGSGG